MQTPHSSPDPGFPAPSGVRLRTFGTLCLGVLVFGLVVTAVLTGGPRRSTAGPEPAPIVPPANVDWHAPAAAPHKVLCELVGLEFRVRVESGPDEPRYTVLSLTGDVLLERGTLSEVSAAFPTLDLGSLKDAQGNSYGPLMLMDAEHP